MYFLRGKKFIVIVISLLTILTFIFCTRAVNNSPKNSLATSTLKVVIDAGHGGIDNGVSGVATGVKESELNLKVAFLLKKCFLNAGFDVVMTRESSAGLYGMATKNLKKKDMQKRKSIILESQPNLVISVHMNKYSVSTRRGAQVFFDENNIEGKLLAEKVQKSLNDMEECVREYSALKGDYYILNSHNFPACIVECGFLSNKEDEALLLTEEYREKVAYAIFKGCVDFLSVNSFYPFI